MGRAHGLDGSFYVLSPEIDALVEGKQVRVGRGRTARIVRRAGTDAKPIVRLEGCDDRTSAEDLRDTQLLVSRAELPALQEGEFWAQDVIGCRVADGDVEVGLVARLLSLPSCEVLEVKRQGRDALLVPMVSDAVRAVDLKERRIEIDLDFLGEA